MCRVVSQGGCRAVADADTLVEEHDNLAFAQNACGTI